MNSLIEQKVFNNLMDKLEIKPAVKKSNAEKFHDWLQRCGNIYMASNEQMARAYAKIIEY